MKKFGTSISIAVMLAALCGTAVAQEPDMATPALAPAPLVLLNGWIGGCFGTATPAVTKIAGVVYFKGAMCSGTVGTAFTLLPKFRPKHSVYVTVDMCNATKGRLVIGTNGSVFVQAETLFSNAQCFTSLEGALFIP
ncbi:MAG TPA: hypothetical protein VIF02_02195 [Methylocella sp.]